jgi:replication factor A1
MEGNYGELVKFISDSSGVKVEEIERKVEAKQAKLSGLISKEGAAQVIAAELNVSFEKQMVKISQIVPGMRKINLIGKIIEMKPIREFNKNGRSGRIGSFTLADETSNVRTVLWDENHIDLIDKGEIKEGGFVDIVNGSVRNGELHLGSFSEINTSEKTIDNIVLEKPVIKKDIKDFNTNDNVSVRAYIVNMFEPKFFEVCPECRKKAVEGKCNEHGIIVPNRRCLLSLVIDDGSDSIRGTIFSEVLDTIFSKEELENTEMFSEKKSDFLGKEMIISGQVRRNQMFDQNDFIVEKLDEVDMDKLIEELEG